MSYVVFNKTRKILRKVQCPLTMKNIQVGDGEFVMEETANDVTQKVGGNIGQYGLKPLGFLKIIDKTPEEIERDMPPKPKPIPIEKQPANITKERLNDIMNRLSKLEAEA